MTPLYNHNSEETAYLIADYPYGFKLRCQMKVWLEHKPSQGWRMVTRTSNPKKPGHWNAPKMSTYCALGGNLFLDNEGHIQWEGGRPMQTLQCWKALQHDSRNRISLWSMASFGAIMRRLQRSWKLRS